MDDELGDFFSEIEKVEQVVTTGSSTSQTTQNNDEVSIPPQKIQKVATVSAKAVPNITYVSDYKSNGSNATGGIIEEVKTAAPSIYEPSTAQSHHTHTSSSSSTTTTTTTASTSNFRAPLPPTPYGSTPLIMTGAQMQAAQQPLLPQPTIPLQSKKFVRAGAGETWVDNTLKEWPANDFRLFVGDLGNEVSTEMLTKEFQKYKSFAKAKVIRGGWNNKSKGYGFVSFLDAFDCAKALREMNGKYLGNRPMKLRKSTWKDNDINEVKKKEKKKRKMAESLGLT